MISGSDRSHARADLAMLTYCRGQALFVWTWQGFRTSLFRSSYIFSERIVLFFFKKSGQYCQVKTIERTRKIWLFSTACVSSCKKECLKRSTFLGAILTENVQRFARCVAMIGQNKRRRRRSMVVPCTVVLHSSHVMIDLSCVYRV